MSVHNKNSGREIRKSGMVVNIRTPNHLHGEDRAEFQAREVDNAIKALKRKMMTEGVIKDIRKKEYYKSRGEIRREKRKAAVRKQRANDAKRDW